MRRVLGWTALSALAAACVVLQGCNQGGEPLDGDGPEAAGDLSAYPGPFTILCRKFVGPFRTEDVQRHVQALASRDMEAAYTVEEPGGTVLYYGHYRRHDSPEATGDVETIRRFVYGDSGQSAFPLARMIPAPRPAEEYYPLTEAPPDAYYSLQIAVFYGPQAEERTFKEAAVLLARSLREDHGREAYVHHGATSSGVFLGAFSPEAIQVYERVPPMLSGDPGKMAASEISTTDMARRTRVVDPRAMALREEFPRMLHNAAHKWQWVHTKVGPNQWKHRKVYSPTVFARIPNRRINEHGEIVIENPLQ